MVQPGAERPEGPPPPRKLEDASPGGVKVQAGASAWDLAEAGPGLCTGVWKYK